MIEIRDEGLVDTVSGLLVSAWTRKYMDFAEHTEEEMNEIIGKLSDDGIKYFVGTNRKAICMGEKVFVKGIGEYYKTWDEVPKEAKCN